MHPYQKERLTKAVIENEKEEDVCEKEHSGGGRSSLNDFPTLF